MMKRCCRCECTKPLEDFALDKRLKDGRFSWCRECQRAYRREWQRRNPERTRANARKWSLQAKYGIDQAEYDRLLAEQGGTCAICRTRPEDERYGVLSVDHDHETGAVRGLLCDRHNRGIGFFDDNIEGLRKAVSYLAVAE